jgi:phage tail sheath protein FI
VTYQSPGVYIEEVPSGPQPIAAASTSVVAVLGTTRKGPLKKPTRVTSWSDFVRTFGAATSRSFTAESVFGFFENGGPAAYIVRVDPSAPASWQVSDAGGGALFTVASASGGSWANGLAVTVGADPDGPKGTFFRGTLTGASSGAAGAYTLPLASTVGLRAGDAVSAVAPLPAGPAPVAAPTPVTGLVTSVSPTSIVTDFAGAVMLPAGSIVAAGAPNLTTVHVTTARGFKAGEVVTIVAPNGARTAQAVVTDAVELGTGMVLTLAAAPGAVAGVGFTQRRVTVPVTVGATTVAPGSPPSTNVGVAALTFGGRAPKPENGQLSADGALRAAARFTTGDGRRATFASNTFAIPGSASVPADGGTVELGVFAFPYVDSGLSLAEFGSADLVDAYGWVPTGTVISFTGSGPAITATRTAATIPANVFTLSAVPAVGDTYSSASVTLPGGTATSLVVRANAEPKAGDALRLGADFAVLTDVTPKGGDAYVLTWATARSVASFTGPTGIFSTQGATIEAERFAITVTPSTGAPERFAGLSLSSAHPSYYAKSGVIKDVSAHITVSGGPDPTTTNLPYFATQTTLGSDVPAASADYVDGLKALEAETEPAMVIAPDAVRFEDPLLQADLIGKLITHCEQFRRFAIIDGPDEDNDQDLANWRNATVSSTYAAVFAPHLSIVTIDPDSIDRYTTVPPSGFVAGVFARTDRERGVHKAPGNERVSGIVGLSESYTQRRQDLLNPSGVNLIRAFPGRGTRIWGARNATDDVTWRYVNVRRLFNMIETSVDRSTQWVVFEPNTASTWIRIKVSVENFLDQQWRAGALAGTKPEEAYRVRVGLGTTMTETDIDLGLVITEVAIAPAKPAEFVVFRFSHKRLSE